MEFFFRMVMLKLRLAGMFGLNGMVEKMGRSFLAQEGVLFNLSEPVEAVYDQIIGACQKMGNSQLGSFYRAEKMGWENMLQGTMALEAEEYEEAVRFYKKVPTESSFFEQALSDGIGALVNSNQEEEALEWFAKLPMTSPHFSVGLINAQAALNNLKRYDEALDIFEQIPEEVGFYSLALSNALRSARGAKSYDKLHQLAKKGYEKYGDEENLYFYGLGKYYLGKYQEVIDLLEDKYEEDDEVSCGLCVDESRGDALYLIGLCYQLLGNLARAEVYFDEVRRLAQSGTKMVITQADGSRQVIQHGYVRAYRPDREGLEEDGFFEVALKDTQTEYEEADSRYIVSDDDDDDDDDDD